MTIMMIMIKVIFILFSVSTTSVVFASCPFSYPISLFVGAYDYFLGLAGSCVVLNYFLAFLNGQISQFLSYLLLTCAVLYASPLSHMCYMPRPSHSYRFVHPNSIGWRVQIIKLLIM